MVWWPCKNIWNYFHRTDEFVEVANSVFKMNRMIGLIPKFITKTEKGKFVIVERPSSVWSMYLAFVAFYGVTISTMGVRLTSQIPLIFAAYYVGRILFAAAIHVSFLRRYREMHASLKDIHNLDVRTPVYWTVIPYAFTGFSAFLSLCRFYFGRNAFKSFVFRWATDILPSMLVTNSCCQICSKVEALRYAIEHFNTNISLMLNRSTKLNLRPTISRNVQIRAACAFLNEAYGEAMFFIISYVLLDLTFAIFGALRSVWTVETYLYVIRSLAHAIPPVALMHVCQQAETSFQTTKVLFARIRKIAERFPSTINEDDQVYEWHILLRQLPVRFNAQGYFNINREVIRVIFWTIASYTVILLQNYQW